MKKKIFISFIVFFVFILVGLVGLVIVYNSEWAHERVDNFYYMSESGFIIDDANEKNSTKSVSEYKANDYIEYEIECDIEQGWLNLSVSRIAVDEEYQVDWDSSVIVYEEEIHSTGKYMFDFSHFEEGFYMIKISSGDGNTKASGTERLFYYYDNWTKLITKLGIEN